jgi:glycosyltransferase involved in cell wall biosynthesis
MLESIGIGITTRNRPDILSYSLAHFAHFGTKNAKYVVVDDNSNLNKPAIPVIETYKHDLDMIYIESSQRLGISGAKNECLRQLADCDHVFLFDDDGWPRADGWAERWIEISKANEVHHSMFIYDEQRLMEIFFVAETLGEGEMAMEAWSNSLGLALHFTRHCLDTIGGFDEWRSSNVYGFEHAQVSIRAAMAGMTKGHRFLAPKIIGDLIYSMDVHHSFYRQPIPLTGKFLQGFRASVTDFEKSKAFDNSSMMIDPPIYIPLDFRPPVYKPIV